MPMRCHRKHVLSLRKGVCCRPYRSPLLLVLVLLQIIAGGRHHVQPMPLLKPSQGALLGCRLRGGFDDSQPSLPSQMFVPRSLALRRLRDQRDQNKPIEVRARSSSAEEASRSGPQVLLAEEKTPTEEDFMQWAQEAEQSERVEGEWSEGEDIAWEAAEAAGPEEGVGEQQWAEEEEGREVPTEEDFRLWHEEAEQTEQETKAGVSEVNARTLSPGAGARHSGAAAGTSKREGRLEAAVERAVVKFGVREVRLPSGGEGEGEAGGAEAQLETLRAVTKLLFRVEQAHWYFLDEERVRDPRLPPLPLPRFVKAAFARVAGLSALGEEEVAAMVRHLSRVKQGTRTCGAILLNKRADKLLLVKGYGSRCWGWPKGKIEEGETDRECAAREVREEVGLDIGARIRAHHFITLTIRRQSRGLRTISVLKLFIIANVAEDAVLRTETVHEIERIAWVPLDAIAPPPGAPAQASGQVRTFLVREVLQRLRVWISENLKAPKHSLGAQRNRQQQRVRERDGEKTRGKGKTRGRTATPQSPSARHARTGTPQSPRRARTATPQSPRRAVPPVPESARQPDATPAASPASASPGLP